MPFPARECRDKADANDARIGCTESRQRVEIEPRAVGGESRQIDGVPDRADVHRRAELAANIGSDALRHRRNRAAAALEVFHQPRRDRARTEVVVKMPDQRRPHGPRNGTEQMHLQAVRVDDVRVERGHLAPQPPHVREDGKAAAHGPSDEAGPRGGFGVGGGQARIPEARQLARKR